MTIINFINKYIEYDNKKINIINMINELNNKNINIFIITFIITPKRLFIMVNKKLYQCIKFNDIYELGGISLLLEQCNMINNLDYFLNIRFNYIIISNISCNKVRDRNNIYLYNYIDMNNLKKYVFI